MRNVLQSFFQKIAMLLLLIESQRLKCSKRQCVAWACFRARNMLYISAVTMEVVEESFVVLYSYFSGYISLLLVMCSISIHRNKWSESFSIFRNIDSCWKSAEWRLEFYFDLWILVRIEDYFILYVERSNVFPLDIFLYNWSHLKLACED